MKILLTILSLLLASTVEAQRAYEERITWQPSQAVSLDLKYARDIQISTWERDEVLIQASVSINDDAANDAWRINIDTTTEQIRIVTDLEPPQKKYSGGCSGHSYHVDEGRYCSLIVYEIYLPRAASLRVETLGGNITLRGIRAPVFAKSLSGFVDADWSAQQGATVTMKSVTGEVYTDLDLGLNEADQKNQQRKSPVGWKIEGRVGDGGPSVQLESISNDIFFRQAGS